MKFHNAFFAIGVVSIALNAAGAMADNTQDFINNATVANEFEIESSKLTLEKSQNKDVKSFAEQMIDDHTKAGDQLKSTLQSANLVGPKEELDSEHQKIMSDLENAKTDDFNHQYIAAQTGAHKDAVKLFSNYAKHGDNTAVQAFAAQTLPTLKEHLEHVKKLKAAE